MTKREEQILALRAKGLTPTQIYQRCHGISRLKIEKTLAANPIKLPPRKVNKEPAKRIKPAVLKCKGTKHCDCVLCEARWYKLRVTHGKINEFGGGSGRHDHASHDGLVVRQEIGEV